MIGHQRIRNRRGARKRTMGYEETFRNEADAKARGATQPRFAANPIEVFAFVSGFSPSLDEGWRMV